MTVHELVEARAAELGDKTFVLFKEDEVSFSELAERMRRVAGGLAKLGLGKGDKIALLLPNCLEFLYSFFGAMTLGAVVVPVNPLLKEAEVSYIINNSDATAIVTCDRFLQRVLAARPECPQLKTVISDGDAEGVVSFQKLLEGGDGGELPPVNEDDVAAIMYTSGTTGKPKGAVLTHGNYMADTEMLLKSVEIFAEDRFLCILPLFHVNAQVVTVLCPLHAGASMILMEGFVPRGFLPALAKYKATTFSAVPTVYAVLNSFPDAEQYDLSHLRFCISGAAPLPVEVVQEFERKYNAFIVEGYGLTEGTCASSVTRLTGERKLGSIGLPLEGQAARIVDDEGNELPPRTVGEITVKGPNVMKEYYNNPEATAETIRDGWLHTGDLGYLDEEGCLYIVDRKKEMIIRGGMNVYPKEIEEVLYRHPAVLEAAIVGLPDKMWGEEIAAFVVLKPGQTLKQRDLVVYCKQNVASYKCPRKVFFVEQLPKTATGKIQKNRIVEQFIAEHPETKAEEESDES
jgi:long-chain acyl-CoA synthetase